MRTSLEAVTVIMPLHSCKCRFQTKKKTTKTNDIRHLSDVTCLRVVTFLACIAHDYFVGSRQHFDNCSSNVKGSICRYLWLLTSYLWGKLLLSQAIEEAFSSGRQSDAKVGWSGQMRQWSKEYITSGLRRPANLLEGMVIFNYGLKHISCDFLVNVIWICRTGMWSLLNFTPGCDRFVLLYSAHFFTF